MQGGVSGAPGATLRLSPGLTLALARVRSLPPQARLCHQQGPWVLSTRGQLGFRPSSPSSELPTKRCGRPSCGQVPGPEHPRGHVGGVCKIASTPVAPRGYDREKKVDVILGRTESPCPPQPGTSNLPALLGRGSDKQREGGQPHVTLQHEDGSSPAAAGKASCSLRQPTAWRR